MAQNKRLFTDAAFTLLILAAAFGVNLLLQALFDSRTMTPLIFVLGVFLISRQTQGYFWGIGASLFSVLLVNYAFTDPYFAFDLIAPESLSSAVVMLIVSSMTSAITTKIKAQEKAKAEAERERMRGNLLRAVSHDLRTPLTSVYGACSTMLENYDELSRQQHLKLLQDVRNEAEWLVRMVENLLSVTRLEDDGVLLNKTDTVLEELIDSTLVKFRKHYPDRRVTVSIPEEFVSIPMDAMLIQQVLINLLENAVFHAKGMENLWLQVTLADGFAEFCVADDGCGIPENRLRGLFTGNLDSNAPTDTGRSNMGIGLSVCSTIIKAHGSTIQGKNRQGGGAQFSFRLKAEE